MTPLSLRLAGANIHIEWPDSHYTLRAVHLRQHCRCADCQRLTRSSTPQKAAEDLQLIDASPVGSYGVQLHFSDGHDRGIYPWRYLRELALLR